MKFRPWFALLTVVLLTAPGCAHKDSSHAGAIALDLSPSIVDAFGLPVYPHATPLDVRSSGARVAALTTADAFETVIAWYSKHLSPDFEASRIAYGGELMTTFADDSHAGRRAVLVKNVTDAEGKAVTTITLMATAAP